VSLPIQKSAAKNCIAVDSAIDSQTVSLSIQKLTAKKLIQKSTAKKLIQKSTAKLCCCRFRNQQRWLSHFGFTSFFLCTFSPSNINFVLEIKETHIDSASRFSEQIP